jgi:hypothetical protein
MDAVAITACESIETVSSSCRRFAEKVTHMLVGRPPAGPAGDSPKRSPICCEGDATELLRIFPSDATRRLLF